QSARTAACPDGEPGRGNRAQPSVGGDRGTSHRRPGCSVSLVTQCREAPSSGPAVGASATGRRARELAARTPTLNPFNLARIFAVLGDKDEALRWLERRSRQVPSGLVAR